jgi:hypothetical protein
MLNLKNVAICALLFISLATPSIDAAQAQEEYWEACIVQVSMQEQTNEMIAKVYVTICDPRTGSTLSSPDVQSAEIDLHNIRSNGVPKKPDIPIYITLVLDSSRSMAGAAPALIKAAKQSLNSTPENSMFSVVQFDEEIRLLQDFTKNIPTLAYAIDQYQVSQKGTCLYDAAYSTVEKMAVTPPGRRTVILFTDGKDENKEGQKCSKHTFKELVEFAMESQVPVSTIGLAYKGKAAINGLELQSLADSTGGISAIENEDNLAAAFAKIMRGLKAQWMIEVPIYPHSGNNDAILNITLKDGTVITKTFSVTSNINYSGPVRAELAGFVFDPARQFHEVQLNLTAPELVGYIRMEVWDTESGSRVAESFPNQVSNNNSFNISTESLIIGRAYTLCIQAISKEDNRPFNITVDDNDNPSPKLCHEFVFDPVSPSIKVPLVVQKNGDLIVGVETTNPDLIGWFNVWLVDENTNTQVSNSNFTTSAIPSSTGTITIPTRANRVKDGTYTVVVRVLDKNKNAYPTAEYQYEGIVYKAPSLFGRLWAALVAEPIYLFSILGIILGMVVFLMFHGSRQKSLGRALEMPIADDDPIRSKSRLPLSSPPNSAEFSSSPAMTSSSSPRQFAPAEPTYTAEPLTHATTIANKLSSHESGNVMMIPSSFKIPLATLTVLKDGSRTLPQEPTVVTQLPFLIGRTEGALLIADSKVSRKHAQITYDNLQQAYYITDTNSSNGTVVNSECVMTGQPVRLSHGSTISLGPNVTFRFDLY